jgi:hypothetical protein
MASLAKDLQDDRTIKTVKFLLYRFLSRGGVSIEGLCRKNSYQILSSLPSYRTVGQFVPGLRGNIRSKRKISGRPPVINFEAV